MVDLLVQILFGWPFILLALALAVIGVSRRKPVLLVGAAVAAAPFSYYLAGTPLFRWAGALLPVFLLVSGVAVRRGQYGWAWALLLPFVGAVAWLAAAVFSQPVG